MGTAGTMLFENFRRRANQSYSNHLELRRLKRVVGTETFSQFGEDAVIKTLLPEGVGTYVDVGAGNPVRGSNSYTFYRMGWRGVLIEPLSWNVHLARKIRPRDRVVQVICGEEEAACEVLYEFHHYEYSTTSKARVNDLAKLGHAPFRQHELEVKSLRRILGRDEILSPSFLTIDVEGMDLAVLRGNDWNIFRPDIIAIEEWISPIDGRTQVQEFLDPYGYKIVAYCGMTSVYALTK